MQSADELKKSTGAGAGDELRANVRQLLRSALNGPRVAIREAGWNGGQAVVLEDFTRQLTRLGASVEAANARAARDHAARAEADKEYSALRQAVKALM
jgi:hypothetical protein